MPAMTAIMTVMAAISNTDMTRKEEKQSIFNIDIEPKKIGYRPGETIQIAIRMISHQPIAEQSIRIMATISGQDILMAEANISTRSIFTLSYSIPPGIDDIAIPIRITAIPGDDIANTSIPILI